MSEEEFDELLDLMSENNLTQHGADTLYGEIVSRGINARLEIERLNNIINELEKDIIEKINNIKNNYSQVNGNYFNMNYVLDTYEDILNKIKELKGSNSNE